MGMIKITCKSFILRTNFLELLTVTKNCEHFESPLMKHCALL